MSHALHVLIRSFALWFMVLGLGAVGGIALFESGAVAVRTIIVFLPVLGVVTSMGFGFDVADLDVRRALIRGAIFSALVTLALGLALHAMSPRPWEFSNLDYTLGPVFFGIFLGAITVARHQSRTGASDDVD